jgi:hypothetical protein
MTSKIYIRLAKFYIRFVKLQIFDNGMYLPELRIKLKIFLGILTGAEPFLILITKTPESQIHFLEGLLKYLEYEISC